MNLINLEATEEENGYKSVIESLLFVWGEPLSLQKIAKILELKPTLVERLLEEMKVRYDEQKSGLQIIEVNKHYQFATRKENYPYIEKLCANTKSKGLSNSALEVLAIIAYKQPITKLDVEQIRGVNCDSALQSLLDRELVEVKGRVEKIGRPQIYGTTHVFLKSFGFKSLSDLPDVDGLEGISIFHEKGATNDSNSKTEGQ